MKLLFDQNISFKIIKILAPHFKNCTQVRFEKIENYSDLKIWGFAKENHYSIITFDADFLDLANLFGHPPKIIWLRFGNKRTIEIADLLVRHKDAIREFLENDTYGNISCLEIS